ncbi:N-acyl-D-amino-acid deacylase [Saccharopolyspora kobensis]|uniref:N-acyl-D-amino-acid deacylase n=1 Tax=Saccharopolyspora kobensis TaxID=146035 RepID=A0A1H5X1A8_9PSEU|nr:D-aminoacylase [Saccharopolyspora kobensis]SEG05582.1 N-acyl-D-amino-acid deacylase [Saccharopolyspora kobensis]SFD81729.1 N-acyl-D-amino-acid deacylase [Saccharopolyspora kobensis]
MFDVVINGGELVDGTGAPRRNGSIGITGDRITEVSSGKLAGRREIDATGQVVAPGFIDLHSHADYTLEGAPAAVTQIHQGVTTLVTGNCGHSPFPFTDLDLIRRASIIDDRALSWKWRDAAGFREVVEGSAVNVALQVGHNAVRLAVLGDADRAPTGTELERMCELVTIAARQGAVGFSTGLIYAPGVFADAAEVRALVAAAASAGLLYSTHMRNEAATLLDAVREAIEAAELAGARLEISHLKAMGPENHGKVVQALALIDAARQRGVDVAADVYPYTASSTSLVSRLSPWAVDGGKDALLARLADPATRERIAAELRARFGRDIDPEGLVIADLPIGAQSADIGLSVAEIGRRDGVDPAEAALRVLVAHAANVMIVNHAMSEADVDTVLRHPWVSVASDGWTMTERGDGRPHPRSFGTFARVLGRYVRERGVLTLEDAVRKMTSLPAARIGLADRGVLAAGKAADVVVLDPAGIIDNSTFEQPWQLASGCSAVLVNGVPVLLDGSPTGRSGGTVLTSAA